MKKITPVQIALLLYVALLLLEAFAVYDADADEIKRHNAAKKEQDISKDRQKIADLEERIEILEKYIITSEKTDCKTDMKSKPEGFNSIMHREAIYNQMKKR